MFKEGILINDDVYDQSRVDDAKKINSEST